jgi:hypothetical protein
LPPEQRAVRRISVRLYPDDEKLLAKLCAKLDSSEGEIIRAALQLLARRHAVRAHDAAQ